MNREKVKPSGLTKQQVSSLAERIATDLDYQPGGDLKAVLDELGGALEYRDFWSTKGSQDPKSGSIEIDGRERFRVYIATDTSASRDRFTIAHEIGHYVLHYLWHLHRGEALGPTWASRYSTGTNDRAEWEANWFAAAFLMPKKAFEDAFQKYDRDLSAVARHFDVSGMAAEVRAKALGLTGD